MIFFLMSKKLYNKRTVHEEYLQGYIEVDTDRKLLLKTPSFFGTHLLFLEQFGIQAVQPVQGKFNNFDTRS